MYLIGTAIGLAGLLGANALVRRLSRVRRMVLTSETPEREKQIIENIRAYIDSRVPDKSLTLLGVSGEFAIEPQRIDPLLRKYADKPFNQYLTELRVEAAKERLRSSNANEVSIAEQCGFKSVEEMERMFLKCGGVTPSRYRLECQVT